MQGLKLDSAPVADHSFHFVRSVRPLFFSYGEYYDSETFNKQGFQTAQNRIIYYHVNNDFDFSAFHLLVH